MVSLEEGEYGEVFIKNRCQELSANSTTWTLGLEKQTLPTRPGHSMGRDES